MWSLPRPRRPMVATRTVSFGLPKTVVEAAAAAAVVMKKLRRSISFVTAIRRLLYHITGIVVNDYGGERTLHCERGGAPRADIDFGDAPIARGRGAAAVGPRPARLERRFETRPGGEEIAHAFGGGGSGGEKALR